MVNKLLQLLQAEIVPAEGCTEPIALAYAASVLTGELEGIADSITAELSGNLIKNVKSVSIPNTCGMVGIESAIATGLLLGTKEKGLMVISNVDTTKLGLVQKYVDEKRISTSKIKGDIKLHLRLTGTLGDKTASVEIQDYHLNIVNITKNGKVIPIAKCGELGGSNFAIDTNFITINKLYDYANSIDLKVIEPLFRKVISYNTAIAEEGLANEYGTAIGKTLAEGMKDGSYGNDIKNKMMSFTAAASDARMAGCSLPVMTTSGSGNQGITASLPIIKYCAEKGLSDEQLIRGLFFSHSSLIHIKSNVGRLSAYCGVICGGAAVAGALAYLDGLPLQQIECAMETTLASLSGIVCDGAKSSCAAKIAVSIGSGYDSYFLAKKGRGFKYGEGIVGVNLEHTLQNVKTLAQEGMYQTDIVVLDVMLKN